MVIKEDGLLLQENHYYPFGLVMEGLGSNSNGMNYTPKNKYLYNGKEMQDDFELNWEDYGARMYDAAVGRWWCMDPKQELYYNATCYGYTANNPVLLIDPNGKTYRINYGSGSYVDYDSKTDYNQKNENGEYKYDEHVRDMYPPY